MKQLLFLLLFSLPFFYVNAQNESIQKPDPSRIIVEDQPRFPGGMQELRKFLEKNTNYPKTAIKDHITGKVIVGFTVGYDGVVRNIHIVNGIREDLDNSAMETIAKMPKWQPGLSDGKPVNVQMSIPLVYGSIQSSNIEFRSWLQDSLKNARQILLTNRAEFKGHSSLTGASAFLIECEEKIFAITAKHLIGEDGGVYPAIKPSALNSVLNEWKLFARNGNSDTITLNKLINIDDNNKDILVFSTNTNTISIQPLKIRKEPLKERESFFVIGCPYSEKNCKQNLYKISHDGKIRGEIMFKGMKGVNISGFSGSPVVDRDGNAVGVLIGSSKLLGATYIIVQPINTIFNCP
jgi:TonB family protein